MNASCYNKFLKVRRIVVNEMTSARHNCREATAQVHTETWFYINITLGEFKSSVAIEVKGNLNIG